MNFDGKKLLIIGHISIDEVVTKSGRGSYWGGAGYHTALAASLYLPKDRVILWSTAGNDFIFSALEEVGVDTKWIKIDKQNKTDIHNLDESGDKRTYSSIGNLSQEIDLSDLSKIKDEIGWIHITSCPPRQQLEWLTQIDKNGLEGVPISCDTFDTFVQEDPELVKKIMNLCNLGFANEVEWKAILGENLKTDMVLKMGKRGAEFFSKGKKLFKILGNEVKVKDTTGAGDVLAGVFLAQILSGIPVEKALNKACQVATMSTINFGTEHLVSSIDLRNNLTVNANRN